MKKAMLSWGLSLFLCAAFGFAGIGCAKEKTPPTAPIYSQRELITRGFWLPNEIDEEAFQLYKDAGLNTVDFVNHEVKTSDGCYYLGSNRTKRALELCRKIGLKAMPAYGDWLSDYEGEKPFSDRDLYGEYKDIIVGMHIVDEPNSSNIEKYGNDALTADYKSAYSVPYMCNLFPTYKKMSDIGYESYGAYLEDYAQKIMCDFDSNRYISVDYYPFSKSGGQEVDWLNCYMQVANVAKKYGGEMQFYVQAAEKNEFAAGLSEAQLRLQVNAGLCFGATGYSYYCYAVPHGDTYTRCLLEQDGTPSALYGYAKAVNAEAQSMASALLSYRWEKSVGIQGEGKDNLSFAVGKLANENYANNHFEGRTGISTVESDGSILVGCFNGTSAEDEGYFLLNFSAENAATATVTLKGSEYVASYGGIAKENGKILQATEGKLSLTLAAGEGIFLVPMK